MSTMQRAAHAASIVVGPTMIRQCLKRAGRFVANINSDS